MGVTDRDNNRKSEQTTNRNWYGLTTNQCQQAYHLTLPIKPPCNDKQTLDSPGHWIMMTNTILNVTVKSPVMTKIHAPLKNNIVPIKTWGLEVGFWFAVFSWWVWGLWCGAFWVWRGQGYLYRHRKITLEIKNGVSQTPETPWLTLCNQFNYLFLKIFWSFILVLW